MKAIGSIILSLLCLTANANTDSSSRSINYSGYLETYYSYDFGNPSYDKTPGFVNHNKHNEIAINLALAKASYRSNKIRGNAGLMFGTYSDANFTNNNAGYKNLYECNVGVKLSKYKNFWFDVGIFPSHIGAESIIGKDNWALTRSFQAEASPYYEAGAKVSYVSQNEKLYASILVLNGWQQISNRYNYPLCFGTQITYKPNEKFLLNSSTYIGNNNLQGSITRQRYFHNFYTQIQWTKHFGTFLGFDCGSQQSINNKKNYELWYSPLIMARYQVNDKQSITIRAEYFRDKYQNVFSTSTYIGFIGNGFSMNYDYRLSKNSVIRFEGKVLNAESAIFRNENGFSNQNSSLTTTLLFHFDD